MIELRVTADGFNGDLPPELRRISHIKYSSLPAKLADRVVVDANSMVIKNRWAGQTAPEGPWVIVFWPSVEIAAGAPDAADQLRIQQMREVRWPPSVVRDVYACGSELRAALVRRGLRDADFEVRENFNDNCELYVEVAHDALRCDFGWRSYVDNQWQWFSIWHGPKVELEDEHWRAVGPTINDVADYIVRRLKSLVERGGAAQQVLHQGPRTHDQGEAFCAGTGTPHHGQGKMRCPNPHCSIVFTPGVLNPPTGRKIPHHWRNSLDVPSDHEVAVWELQQ